jgi:hypothetical protein
LHAFSLCFHGVTVLPCGIVMRAAKKRSAQALVLKGMRGSSSV